MHIKAGSELEMQCDLLRDKMKVGGVCITSGGKLPVKYILHVATPKRKDEQDDSYDLLKSCYMNILLAATRKLDIHHLVIPLIGTGAMGYSLKEPFYAHSVYSLTAVTILAAIARFPAEYINSRILEQVTIICSSEENYEIMKKTYQWIFGKGISKRERVRGSLLGGAIGDALGYPVEFRGHKDSQIKNYILDSKTGKALISDDTQMTLYTACGLLWGSTRFCIKGIGGKIWGYIHESYKDWLKTQILSHERGGGISWIRYIPELNARRAPGRTCISALMAGGGSVDKPINNSKGCGGVMRIAPIPLYGVANRHFNQKENAKICAETAAITHGHPLGWLSAVALGNIIFDIMQNFSLAYSVQDTVFFLKKNYTDYPDTKRMIGLIEEATLLASKSRYVDSADLIEECNVTERLGEGWVGEEALVIGLFCVLATMNQGMDPCLWNAVGHRGDSDSTASIAGQIWGAYFGEKNLPAKWLRKLELKDVIEEIADDLVNDCKMSDYSYYDDPAWGRKYYLAEGNAYMDLKQKDARHLYTQIPFQVLLDPFLTIIVRNSNGEPTGEYKLYLENGKFLHLSQNKEDAHKGFSGFGFTDLHYDIKKEGYVESHGWVRMLKNGSAEGCYCNFPFVLLPNYANRSVEVLSEIRTNPWIGTIRRRTDEWNNPIEMEFRDIGIKIPWEGFILVIMKGSLKDIFSFS